MLFFEVSRTRPRNMSVRQNMKPAIPAKKHPYDARVCKKTSKEFWPHRETKKRMMITNRFNQLNRYTKHKKTTTLRKNSS